MLLATRCAGCGRIGPTPCAACVATMARAGPVTPVAGLDRVAAALAYDGAAREVVARVKYRNERAVVGWLAALVAELLRPGEVDVVTWAPTTEARRRRRGFDQAELLARRVARECGLPCRDLLRRGAGPPQTGRDAAHRQVGPAFSPRRRLDGVAVAVIDDVVTTGATLGAAGRALGAAGAGRRIGLAAAHPP